MDIIEKTDYRKASPEALYETRKVVIRMWKSKKDVAEIIAATDLSKDTVYVTIRAYKQGGMKALKPKTRGRKKGEKRHLSKEQEHELINMLVDHNPEQYKIKGCMWTRDSVRENAEIFWGDETAVQNVANYARGYALKGHTPVVRVQAKKMHINMISAISNQGRLHFLLYSDSIDSDKLISFMESLVKTAAGKKVFLILDNLKVHHSKKVSEWVAERTAQIRLFHLPPYSPEYNPDEYLNNDLKRNIGTQAMTKDVQELEQHTNSFMTRISEDSEHVKSYFNHPALNAYKLN